MIGLGSNRLTVCRRGGMSVTQAGKGGMEWLAGGRGPSWSSPYSAQATAALKAQFPTQWPTIRDYGFAHPEIVPLINLVIENYFAEDNNVAYSVLPPLGKKRYISSTGNKYIKLGLKPTTTSYVHAKFKLDNSNTQYPWAFGTENTTLSVRLGVWLNETTLAPRIGSFTPNITRSNVNNPLDIIAKDGEVTINGEYQGTFTLSESIDYEMYLFAVNLNNGAMRDGAPMYGSIEYFEMDGHIFIPFKRNNVMYMLDVTTGSLATNVGTFSEVLIETPAS